MVQNGAQWCIFRPARRNAQATYPWCIVARQESPFSPQKRQPWCKTVHNGASLSKCAGCTMADNSGVFTPGNRHAMHPDARRCAAANRFDTIDPAANLLLEQLPTIHQ
jgi:hypothetical protein